jgi:hypothetical protein
MRFLLLSALIVSLLPCATVVAEEQLKPLQLPAPQTDGGRPLMQAR